MGQSALLVKLVIEHDALDDAAVRAVLSAEFGQDNPQVLERSTFDAEGRRFLGPLLVLSTESLTYRLLALRSGSTRLDVVIEDTGRASVLAEAASVWKRINRALHMNSPQLAAAVAQESMRSTDLLVGRLGVRQHLRQDAFLVPALVALGVALFILVASQTIATSTWPVMLLTLITPAIGAGYFFVKLLRRGLTGQMFWEASGGS